MTTLKQIKEKSKQLIKSIDDYYFILAIAGTTDDPVADKRLNDVVTHCTELTQMISNAAKVTETITETE